MVIIEHCEVHIPIDIQGSWNEVVSLHDNNHIFGAKEWEEQCKTNISNFCAKFLIDNNMGGFDVRMGRVGLRFAMKMN